MHARLRLDVRSADLAFAGIAWAAAWTGRRARERIEARFGAGALTCLSVRSGLDLYLTALALPAGSEVLVSGLTIRGMLEVIEAHDLVAVPLDVELGDMLPRPESLRAAASERARLVLVAQLFGTRGGLDALSLEAERLGLPLVEDCAQAWLADGYSGHPRAAAALFSFGFIKTGTALGGAVVLVRDAEVLARMRALEAEQPVQARAVFARRLAKGIAFAGLAHPRAYEPFTRWCGRTGRDLDALLHGSVRGFSARDLMTQLRRRPSPPILALLDHRLARDPTSSIARRRASGARLAELLRGVLPLPGIDAPVHGFWVFPVLVSAPEALVDALRAAGFDATRVSSLVVVEPPADRPQLEPGNARSLLERVVFLPAGAHVPVEELERQAEVVRRFVGADGAPLEHARQTREAPPRFQPAQKDST